MAKLKQLIAKLKKLLGFVKEHWNEPPKGRYLSFKEWAGFCIGAMGIYAGSVLPTFITLGAGIYIAAALEINVDHILYVGIFTAIFTILKSPLTSMIIDNTQTKWGKFRPYLLWMPIPIILTMSLTGWIPFTLKDNLAIDFQDYNANYWIMLGSFALLFNIMQFFVGLYTNAFNMLIQVISPNPEERTDMMSYGSFVYSLGPSITNPLFPLVANLLYSQYLFDSAGNHVLNEAGEKVKVMGTNTRGPYTWLLPVFALVCFGLGLITFKYSRERMVIPKTYKQRVKFVDGVKKTFRNKYFWIQNLSTSLGVFKLIGTSYLVWICTYILAPQYANKPDFAASSQAIFTTLMGMACTPGLLLAPLLIKKLGKKNLIIATNIIPLILMIPMIIFVNKPFLLLTFSFFISMVNAVQVVTTPAINSQILDYQQYKTGDRLEGFITQFGGIITTTFGIATMFVQPAIYKHFGYFDKVDVLYNQAEVLYPILRTCFIVGIVSGVLGTIPMLFWNLTEKRHHQIMSVLTVRANLADGQCDEETATDLERRIEAGEPDVLDYFTVAASAVIDAVTPDVPLGPDVE